MFADLLRTVEPTGHNLMEFAKIFMLESFKKFIIFFKKKKKKHIGILKILIGFNIKF